MDLVCSKLERSMKFDRIMEEWKREANIDYDIFWTYEVFGRATVYVAMPSDMLGTDDALYRKYAKKLYDECHVSHVSFRMLYHNYIDDDSTFIVKQRGYFV